MPIYIKYGSILGDVTAEGHKGADGWVEINSFKFGVARGFACLTGRSTDRESGAPSVSNILIAKAMDKSSFRWFEESLHGEGVDVQIDFCKTDKGKLEVYTTYLLENAMVSAYTVSSGGDRPTESISINFTKIVYNYSESTAAGAQGKTPKAGWNIALAKSI